MKASKLITPRLIMRSLQLRATTDYDMKERKRSFLTINKEETFSIRVLSQRSVHLPRLEFTNKIKNDSRNNLLHTHIGDVLRLHNECVKWDQIPFDNIDIVDFDHKVTGTRILNIFTKLDLIVDNVDCFEKASVVPFNRLKGGAKQFGDKFRVIMNVDFPTNSIDVLLLDPHHMLADSNYSKIYKEHKSNSTCFSCLKNKFE